MATKTTAKKTEAVKETAEAVKAAEETTVTAEPKRLMYIGPTLTKHGVIQNVIYEGLPTTAVEVMGKFPLFKALFIDPKDYPSAERSIREQTGHYWAAYLAALNYK